MVHTLRSDALVTATTLTINTALGTVPFTAEIPDGPMRLSQLVPIVYALTGLVVDRAVERSKLGGAPVSCRKGCGACCRQLVAMSAPEAFHLAERVHAEPEPTRAALLEGIRVQRAALETHGLAADVDAFLEGKLEPEARKHLAVKYFQPRIGCAFLGADEACRLHLDRPATCRDLNVTSPAEWCDAPKGPLQRVPTPPLLSGPLARLTARLTGGRVTLVPLPLALVYAEREADLAQRRWPGDELFAAFREEMRGRRS